MFWMIKLLMINFILIINMINLSNKWMFLNFITIMMIMSCLMNNFHSIHPLNLNILILFMTLLISINLSVMNKTSWYSFMIFLIMVSGMMVLFMYFMSFSINEYTMMDNMKMNKMMIKLIMLSTLMLIMKNNLFKMIQILNKNKLSLYQESMSLMIDINNKTLPYMYMKIMNYQSLYLIMYLILLLMVISYICTMKKYSIRQMK